MKSLTTSPQIWQDIFNGIEDPVLMVRPDGSIIEANQATLKAAGKDRSEVIGQGICRIIHGGRWPHIRCPLEVFLANCTSKTEEVRLPGLNGEYHLSIAPIKDALGNVDKILLIAREMTRDQIRKVDYYRNAHLAALGELAAGVAHEINNPITGVINFAQILLDSNTLDPEGIEVVEKIIREGDRIATITRNLISFARADIGLHEPVDPVQIINASLSLVNHQLQKEGIRIVTDFPVKPILIRADFRKIQQVLLNLISNSRYALNARYPGCNDNKRIEITCAEQYAEGRRVMRIKVKDYGTGLPQSLLEHIFEPFFSTKPPGEGTGLGLSISYGIVKEHGGKLKVNSIIEQFTEMIIELPAGI